MPKAIIYQQRTAPILPPVPPLPPLTWLAPLEQPRGVVTRFGYLTATTIAPLVPPIPAVPPIAWLAPIAQPRPIPPRLDYLMPAGALETMRGLVGHGWLQPMQQPMVALRALTYLTLPLTDWPFELPPPPPVVFLPPTTGILRYRRGTQAVAMGATPTTGTLALAPQTTGELELP